MRSKAFRILLFWRTLDLLRGFGRGFYYGFFCLRTPALETVVYLTVAFIQGLLVRILLR